MHAGIFLALVGTPSLKSLHQISKQDGGAWNELKNCLYDHTININTVGGLSVLALAPFLTAPPPTDFAKWDSAFPYFCIGAAYAASALSIASGLCLLVFLNVMRPESIEVA
ncbi:hypothetical protein EDC04DRAFT_1248317 [Pisolithus marmoratus]|nr:hypothetical protein EDC04DRAFT_1248317 [Pisolithus marmoratus]